jgi:hypothetical protein
VGNERVDKHDKIHHELFDEDTAQIGSLGDIVEKHAGDAVFLGASEKSPGGADGGEGDFEAEMNDTDPDDGYYREERLEADEIYVAEEPGYAESTDQTGSVPGIARGFGTHLPQDLGPDGFQVEEIPDGLLKTHYVVAGEELDDYDDKPGRSKAR